MYRVFKNNVSIGLQGGTILMIIKNTELIERKKAQLKIILIYRSYFAFSIDLGMKKKLDVQLKNLA